MATKSIILRWKQRKKGACIKVSMERPTLEKYSAVSVGYLSLMPGSCACRFSTKIISKLCQFYFFNNFIKENKDILEKVKKYDIVIDISY